MNERTPVNTTATTAPCENSVQTIMRWGGQLVGVATVLLFVGMFFYFVYLAAIGLVAAVVMLTAGVHQSFRLSKSSTDRMCLYAAFYAATLPLNIMLGGLVVRDGGYEVMWLAALGYKLTVMFTAYIVLRHLILPRIMRRSSLTVHNHTAWITTVLLWPCYAVPLHKLGVSMIFCHLGDSFLGWLSP